MMVGVVPIKPFGPFHSYGPAGVDELPSNTMSAVVQSNNGRGLGVITAPVIISFALVRSAKLEHQTWIEAFAYKSK